MIYEVSKLGFSYGKHRVLKDVNLTLAEGELLCVLGKNGCGKSTLFSCLLGLRKGFEGSIRLEDREISQMKEREIASAVSFVPQSSSFAFGFSAYEYVLMGRAANVKIFSHPSEQDCVAALNALEIMGISNFKDRSINELSGGEMQQVAIARALASEPRAILFDEPTSHLDYCNQIKVLKVIKDLSEKGYTVCISTHDPNHALMLGGNVALIDDGGCLHKGSADEMISEEMLGKIYGQEMKIRYLEEFKRRVCLYPNI